MKGKHKDQNYNRTSDEVAILIRLLDFKLVEELFSKGLGLYKQVI